MDFLRPVGRETALAARAGKSYRGEARGLKGTA